MRGWRVWIAAVLVVSAMAGCIGGEDAAETTNESVAPQSVENVTNGTIETTLHEGFVSFSVATPALSFNANSPVASGPFLFPLERPSNATGYVLELVWEPATSASENLDLWVRDASEGNIPPSDPTDPLPADPVATATGSSPLKLVVEESALEADTDYNLIVRAPSDMGAGVAVQQAFELHVSTFLDKPVDEEHSAVDGTASG